MGNTNLHDAKRNKNDEFYTQFNDIQNEVNAYLEYDANVFRDKVILCPCDDPKESNFTKFFALNFEAFGLKKLISTGYAHDGGHGKIFVLDHDTDGSGRIDPNDIESFPLEGDGDFRSEEVCRLRDEADIIVTNPPFSLFREFLAWIIEADKKFLVIGNKNAVTYKEVFPLIKENKMWSGASRWSSMWFVTDKPDTAEKIVDGKSMQSVASVWFTNLEHGRRHQPLSLMSYSDNVRFSRHKEIKGIGYMHYDNYDAIEVSFTDAIPDDYDGVMGVPISFLDKYCPEQFELIWTTDRGGDGYLDFLKKEHDRFDAPVVGGKGLYKRIFIRKKPSTT